MARPSAAPSVGSVPAPSSSSSTRLCASASFRMKAIREICELNVLSDCSRLCSSPMSARMRLKTGTLLPSPAGMCMPHWAIRQSRPGRLEADGFAAGVRPRDDEQVEAEAEADVDRDHLTFRSQGGRRLAVPDLCLTPDS